MTQSEQLKKAVQKSGLKISHICEKVGVSAPTYSNFTIKGTGLNTKNLEKFAEVLGYSIEWVKKSSWHTTSKQKHRK